MNCQAHRYRGQDPRAVTRRWFFKECGVGLGALALAQLLGDRRLSAASAPPSALAPRAPHFAPRAKRVIYLFMAGAPSHLELFDNKPELGRWNGKLPPADLLKDYRAAFINPNSALLGPKFQFARHGKCGAELSELLPHLAGVADDIAILKAMHTDAFNHAPAQILMNTGSPQFGRPSMGSWVTYGLGSESSDFPAFVVFNTGTNGTSGGSANWGAGFLPTVYQGVQFNNTGEPVLYLRNPQGVDEEVQRDSLAAIRDLDQERLDSVGDPEIATRISSFEMAYRMQSSAPELMDLTREPRSVLEMYDAEHGPRLRSRGPDPGRADERPRPPRPPGTGGAPPGHGPGAPHRLARPRVHRPDLLPGDPARGRKRARRLPRDPGPLRYGTPRGQRPGSPPRPPRPRRDRPGAPPGSGAGAGGPAGLRTRGDLSRPTPAPLVRRGHFPSTSS